jgi:hypothetical protein
MQLASAVSVDLAHVAALKHPATRVSCDRAA